MKNNKYFLPTTLAATLGAILLGASLVRAFVPAVMIPSLDIPMVPIQESDQGLLHCRQILCQLSY